MTTSAQTIELTLAAELGALAQARQPAGERTAEAVRKVLGELVGSLGIPGSVSVSLAVGPNASDQPWLGVNVGDRACRYPGALLARVRSYVTAQPVAFDPNAQATLAWLREVVSSGTDDGLGQAIEFIAVACAQIVKLQPECLFNAAQGAAFAVAIPPVERMPDLERRMAEDKGCLRALRKVLSLGVSLGDRDRVSEIMAAGLEGDRTWDQIAEDLIDALAPDEIEIRMPREYLRLLTTLDPGAGGGPEASTTSSGSDSRDKLFPMMRDNLFYELGWRFPDFRVVCDEKLKAGTFAFRLNHLTTMPYVALHADQCLVNETVKRLKPLHIAAIPTTYPPDGREAAIIDTMTRSVAQGARLTTWDAFDYLILCLSADLRATSPRFVLRRTTEHVLQQLDPAIPALIRAARRKFSLEQITQVLREMLAEQVSVRNMRLILECMCDYDYIIADTHQHIIFDDRLSVSRKPNADWLCEATQIAALVRSGLKRQLSHQYTRGASTLVVYLLDPVIERTIGAAVAPDARTGAAPPLSVADQERLLAAVREELHIAPHEGNPPAVLTTQDVRGAVRQMLAHEFPTLPVLAYQELSPDMNIQPIARISWNY